VLAFFGATHRITSRKALMFPRKTEMHPSVNLQIINLLTFDTRLTLLTFSSSVPVLDSDPFFLFLFLFLFVFLFLFLFVFLFMFVLFFLVSQVWVSCFQKTIYLDPALTDFTKQTTEHITTTQKKKHITTEHNSTC